MSERLAAMAEKHYREFLPEAVATLDDPTEFFLRLGADAQTEIETLAEALRGPDPTDEPFAEKMARYNVARQTAESEVIREMVLVSPTQNVTATQTQEDRQTNEDLRLALTDFQTAMDAFRDL
jgi:hypothetical protein